MKIMPYTAVTNNKDAVRDDITVFSDYDKFKDPVMNAKIYKVLSHKYLDCDISIWMDGNIFLNITPEQAVNQWLGENDIAFFRHYKSKNIDWELKWIKYVWRSRDRRVYEEAIRQVNEYQKYNIQKDEMGMGGFIIRRHNPLIERFNEAWWSEICRWGQRDQLSLPVVLRLFPELKISRINLDIKKNQFLKYNDHQHYKT